MRLHHLALASILGISLIGCATQQVSSHNQPADALPATPPPFSADTRFAAGQVDESQHNPAAAIQQYEEALKLSPNHLGALYRLGTLYAETKQFPEAIDIWERYLAASNQSATAFGDLGFCQELAGETDKAEASYQAGIARDYKNATCRTNYGLMLARRGKMDEAVTQWRFVLSEAEIHYNLGGVYAAEGNKIKAHYEFQKALEIDPNFADARQRVSALDSN
jgi:tetratricopeptide (TPR) repeat protein